MEGVMNTDQFQEFAKQMVQYIGTYFETIRERKVMSTVSPGFMEMLLPSEAPQKPSPWQSVMAEIESIIIPGITHWQHPNFCGFFNTTSSYPSIVADMLISALGVVGLTWISSPSVIELEMVMMDWLAKLINLPSEFLNSTNGKGGGLIQTSTSESNFIALLAARTRKIEQLKQTNPELSYGDIISKMVAYCSEQAHSSSKRCAMLAGIQVKAIRANKSNVLTGDIVRWQIQKDLDDGLIPFFIIVTLGTTNSCAFDDLSTIGPLCESNKIWVHIDAAYGGTAFICQEYQHYMKGIESSDSYCFNPHKWMLISLDCCAMWLKDKSWMMDYYNADGVYAQSNGIKSIDTMRNCSVQFSRRFRSLKLWMVFKIYGVEHIQNFIRNHIKLAKQFESFVMKDDNFELIQEVTLGLICFRLKGENSLTKCLLQKIYERCEIFLVPGKINGVFFLRVAIGSIFIKPEDVKLIWNEISLLGREVVEESNETYIK